MGELECKPVKGDGRQTQQWQHPLRWKFDQNGTSRKARDCVPVFDLETSCAIGNRNKRRRRRRRVIKKG